MSVCYVRECIVNQAVFTIDGISLYAFSIRFI